MIAILLAVCSLALALTLAAIVTRTALRLGDTLPTDSRPAGKPDRDEQSIRDASQVLWLLATGLYFAAGAAGIWLLVQTK